MTFPINTKLYVTKYHFEYKHKDVRTNMNAVGRAVALIPQDVFIVRLYMFYQCGGHRSVALDKHFEIAIVACHLSIYIRYTANICLPLVQTNVCF
jgi:hypothetical protein